MKKKKQKKEEPLNNQETTSSKQPSETDDVVFSFKYLDLDSNPKFSIEGCGESYLQKMLLRLKDISHIKYNDFVKSRSPSLRWHKIKWRETTEPAGFICLNQKLRQQPAFQFAISSNEYGRVHGFLLERIFYVVWLDPHHRLYS